MKKINYILIFSLCLCLSLYSRAKQAKQKNNLISILENKKLEDQNSLFLNHKKLYGFKLTTAEQKQFFKAFKTKKYKEALYQWKPAFSNTVFIYSSTGQALLSYLLWKNKFFISGVDTLFAIKNPNKINKHLLQKWKLELKNNMSYWTKVPKLHWNKKWTKLLSANLKSRYLAYHSYQLSSKELHKLVKTINLKSKEGIYLQWQWALALYLENKSKQSAKVLSYLSKSGQTVIEKDLIFLTMARVLYGNNFLNLAIKYYKKIPKSSIYWFVAQEEIAWSYLRSGKLEKSLSILATSTKGIFYYKSLSDSLFLKSLVELKTCNYLAVSKSILMFKKLIKQRIVVLEKIKSQANTKIIKNWLSLIDKKNKKALIKLSAKIPFVAPNDNRLSFLLQQKKIFLQESALAKTFFKESLSKGSNLGFQFFFKSLSRRLRKQSAAWQSLITLEIKKLASSELADIKVHIANLKVLELEMLQQVNTLAQTMSNKKINKNLSKQVNFFKKNNFLKTNTGKDKDTAKDTSKKQKMYFSTNSEVWLDELGSYKVQLKSLCNANM